MRIALEVRALHRSLRGSGQWRYAYNLIRHLASLDDRNEYLFFAPHDASALDIPSLPVGFRFRYQSLPLRAVQKRRWLLDQLLVPMFLRRHRIAVCHFLLQTATLWKPCRFVVTAYDTMAELFPEYRSVRQSWAYRMQSWAMARADRVVAISRNTSRDLTGRRGLDPRRIHVVPLAPDPVFRPASDPAESEDIRRRHRIAERFVLSVLSYEPRKNTLGVIRAFARFVNDTGLPHELVLFGDRGFGVDQQSIDRALTDTGLRHRIRLVGRVPDDELAGLYGSAEFFVFPSLYEGFGLPVLEALACGTTVVASNASSLPEIVGDTAVLVDATSVDAIARAMADLAVNAPRRQRLGALALARSRRFSWADTARATLQIYQELGDPPVSGRARANEAQTSG